MINPIGNNNIIGSGQIAKDKATEKQTSDFEKTLKNAIDGKDEKKLKEACQSLEASFVNMMFKQMRETVEKSKLFESDSAEETYEDMLYENYSDEISKNRGIGIGDMLYKQMSKEIQKKGEVDDVK